MPETEKYAAPLNLQEGWLALDFTNIVGWQIQQSSQPLPFDYATLTSWVQHAGGIVQEETDALVKKAMRHPSRAEHVLEKTITLYQTLERIFLAVALEASPKGKDLNALNAFLSDALSKLKILSETDGFIWGWGESRSNLERPLWPIVWSATELLTSKDLNRVGKCANEACRWFFLDTSKNHSRRWCSMQMCGNVAKARRHYRRKQNSPS